MLSAKDLLTAHHQAEQSQRAEQQRLALEKRRDIRKQADLDAGRLVRIRFDHPGEEPQTALYPPRVAAFICKVLGATQRSARDCVRWSFTTQGRQHTAYYLEDKADLAVLALLAHARADARRQRRRQVA